MPAEKALVNYIRDAVAAGGTFEEIRTILKSQDWPDIAIDQAMAVAAQPARPSAFPRALAAPLPPNPLPGFQPAPLTTPHIGAPHGFALALAGGLALLFRTLGSAAGLPAPFAGALAPAGLLIGSLFAVLIILSAVLLKKGKFPAGAIILALSLVLIAFSPELTVQAPLLLAAAGGALGLAKR